MVRVSASILSFYANAHLRKESSESMLLRINAALKEKDGRFDILHLDIMDGRFVEEKSFSTAQIRKIKCSKKREAHFMVLNYKRYIKDYFDLAEMFIFHNEILKSDFDKIIDFLKKNNKFVGISISPETPVDNIRYLNKINLVLVMSVYPGKPGQKFLNTTYRKIQKLSQIRRQKNLSFSIEVDGGIDKDIAVRCAKAGADIVVMGSKLFKSE
jgi:ribulose-phosphate 3-epimerase